jgi:hypothetical protein
MLTKGRGSASPPPKAQRALDPDLLYPLDEFIALTRLKRTALRTARQNGLNIRYVGGRGFVLGRDFQDYVAKRGKASLR